MLIDHRIDEVARLVGIPQIACMKACVASVCSRRICGRVASADGDFAAGRKQCFGNRTSEAAGTASDDRNFAR